ncbi:MAG TPA: polymorphic toxin-type HINT domain-containing protein [Pyrinomonadaceae bacterium]|nr:polymorphic toxin-type HINT domain-containing protein [Pyrinomonadaceae bacterium]
MPNLPPEAIDAFDQKAAPWLDGKVGEQVDHYHEEQENYRQKSEETREEGRRQITEATEGVRKEQEGSRAKARSEVAAERGAWRAEHQLILKDYTDQSETKRKDVDEKIQTKVKDSEKQADDEMTKAEAKAAEEKRKAEDKAAEEKRKEESKPRSWWDKVKGAVSSVFNAIKKAVTAIFDALRWAVKKIIQGVKAIVRGIIEVARMAIVGLIKTFGLVLKGLVTVALLGFPKAAAKARAAIDAAVDTSVDAVNSAAEWLKSKTDAILDWVGSVLDKALAFVQTVIVIGLEIMRLIATGQLRELWEKLKNLAKSAWEGLGLIEGYVWEELVGFDITKPLGPQLAGGGAEGDGSGGEGSLQEAIAAPENLDFFLQDTIRPDQVEVQPVTKLELDDELLSELSLAAGQPLQLDLSADPERGLEGAKAELLAHLPQEPVPAGPQQSEEAAAMSDPKMQAVLERAMAAKTRGERLAIIKDLMFETIKSAATKYWEEKIKPNLYWIIPAAIVGIAAFIAAEIYTGGAITGALPVILEIIGAAFIAQAIAKIAEGLGIWLEKGWAGDVSGAAKGFGKGFAGALIEIITVLLMEIGGAALRATLKGLGKVMKLAMSGGKALGRVLVRGGKGLVKGVVYVGKFAVKAARITGRMVSRSGKFVLEKGRLLFKGLQPTFAKGIKRVEELWKRLKGWFGKFKGFYPEPRGLLIYIYAVFNPDKILVAIVPAVKQISKAWEDHRWGDSSKLPCFPAGTIVKTPIGDRKIEELLEGDQVFACNLDSKSVVTRSVLKTFKNWTQHLVDIHVGETTVTATRGHLFWVDNKNAWLPAVELEAGMTLRLINQDVVIIQSIEVHAAETTTYNFEVFPEHNYFVGVSGILAHNASKFESLAKIDIEIYRIVDPKGNVVYVGQTVQGVDVRFNQHINSPKHPHWKAGYKPIRITGGNWTAYEAAVWEQHYIDANGGVAKLENRINAITEGKYNDFKKLHDPC